MSSKPGSRPVNSSLLLTESISFCNWRTSSKTTWDVLKRPSRKICRDLYWKVECEYFHGFVFMHYISNFMGRMELAPTIGEAVDAYKNVESWAKPTKPHFNMNFFAMKPLIRKEGKGTVLIISPFNYPIYLTLGPLVSSTCFPFHSSGAYTGV